MTVQGEYMKGFEVGLSAGRTEARALHLLGRQILTALDDQELSPSEIALWLGVDVRAVREAGAWLVEQGEVVVEHHLDTEVWRVA